MTSWSSALTAVTARQVNIGNGDDGVDRHFVDVDDKFVRNVTWCRELGFPSLVGRRGRYSLRLLTSPPGGLNAHGDLFSEIDLDEVNGATVRRTGCRCTSFTMAGPHRY